jgi:hypothetical protein
LLRKIRRQARAHGLTLQTLRQSPGHDVVRVGSVLVTIPRVEELTQPTARGILAAVDLGDTEGRPWQPRKLPRRLVALAAAVLPAGHRVRYAQEWQAELWELGQQPRQRWRQLAHAVGVLSRCVALRRGLVEPVPGRAAGARSEG